MSRTESKFFRPLIFVATSFAAAIFGCWQSKPPDQAMPDSGTEIVLKVRPMIVDGGGESTWTDEKIRQQLIPLASIWSEAGIWFDVQGMFLTLQNSNLFNIESRAEWDELCIFSMNHYKDHGEILIWFVNSLTIGDNHYAGLSNYPSNSPALEFTQHGVALARFADASTLAHELGHAVNLKHSWEYIECEPSDCDGIDWCACNIMSYCTKNRESLECQGLRLSSQQVVVAHAWAFSPARVRAVSSPAVSRAARMRFEYTENTDPVR